MADLENRLAREEALARRLGRANAEARRVLIAALEDGEITEAEWDEITRAFAQPIQAELERVFFEHAQTAADALQVADLDTDLINRAAVDWARQHAGELAGRMNARNRELLREAIADYFARRMTLGDLEQRLARAFSPSRAAELATTETTRAASAAEQFHVDRLRMMGLQPVIVWQTNRDSRVCPTCGPRHNTRQGDGWQDLPPAHRRCRCWVRTEVVRA